MPHAAEHTDIRDRVDRLLGEAVERRASDIHLDPEAGGYAVRFRTDGVLETLDRLDTAVGRAAVTRLMVMAQLLTYRLDIPQEGRLAVVHGGRALDLRVSIMPTVEGLRGVVRLPAELSQPRELQALGLPEAVEAGLRRFAACDQGLLLVTGPAGAGKTTTIYALLEHLRAAQPGVSIVTLEDPVERRLAGVVQVEVTPQGEMTYERALRSMLRQDPQVLMLGEVRDAPTASIAVQAALSGHRLIATLHAGSPETAVARLLEMGLEPYQVTSALYGVVSQRLLRRRAQSAYTRRFPVAEMVVMNDALRRAVLARADAARLRQIIADEPRHISLHEAARQAVAQGVTDEAEVLRVLGAP